MDYTINVIAQILLNLVVLITSVIVCLIAKGRKTNAKEEKPKNIVVKLKNTKSLSEEEWIGVYKISDDLDKDVGLSCRLPRIPIK